MGTDIHVYPEVVRMDFVRPLGGVAVQRDYGLFGVLALHREGAPVVPPKGMPENPGWLAHGDYYLRIRKNGEEEKGGRTCSPEEAERWIRAGLSRKVGDLLTHPDWHTPSWLDVCELEEACAEYRRRFVRPSLDLEGLTAMLRAHRSDGSPRLVFWFDC